MGLAQAPPFERICLLQVLPYQQFHIKSKLNYFKIFLLQLSNIKLCLIKWDFINNGLVSNIILLLSWLESNCISISNRFLEARA